MISIETVHSRFFTGDSITYNGSSTQWLIEQAAEANDPAMRHYAAAGVMRALLDTPVGERNHDAFFGAVDWTRQAIADVQASKAEFEPMDNETRDYLESLPPVSGLFDAASMKATTANKPHVTAAIIDRFVPRDEPKLVIGLGHSGILSSIATYEALAGDNMFHPVRYSRNKTHDSAPVVSDGELERLHDLAEDRTVIVHDEDRGLCGDTIRGAIRYIDDVLDVSALGVTPVNARHPNHMWPEIIRRERYGKGFEAKSYSTWSDEYEEILAAAERNRVSD
jgi:hypothetical protein